MWRLMLASIAGSFVVDGLVLALFAWAGAIAAWIPLAYVGAGLASCATFHAAITRGATMRFEDPLATLGQLAVAALIEVAFIVLAPPVALYFVAVLFVLFGFASLRLRFGEAIVAWAAVSIAVSVAIALLPGALDIPTGTALERLLVVVSILLTLGRCMLLGVFGSRLRARIGDRYRAYRASSESAGRQSAAVAQALHEDLGQDLAGIAMTLSAQENRLRREGHEAADALAQAGTQLRIAVNKTRRLALSLRAEPEHGRIAATAAERGELPLDRRFAG
jgi:signal transduction histidine kinase